VSGALLLCTAISKVGCAYRAQVPGGWLVFTYWGSAYAGQTFYPDPNHQWDGSNKPTTDY